MLCAGKRRPRDKLLLSWQISHVVNCTWKGEGREITDRIAVMATSCMPGLAIFCVCLVHLVCVDYLKF